MDKDSEDLGLPHKYRYYGLRDLCGVFSAQASFVTRGRGMEDKILRQHAVIAFGLHEGSIKLSPALEKGDLEIFRAELRAMSLAKVLSEQEMGSLIPEVFKTDGVSKAFSHRGAPTLARLYTPKP